jgi:hypothetical protein
MRERDNDHAGELPSPAAPGLGSASEAAPTHRPRLAAVLAAQDALGLQELYRFWSASNGAALPRDLDADGTRALLRTWMQDPPILEARMANLGKRLRGVLQAHLEARDYQLSVSELASRKEFQHLSSYELEAALAMLQRHGLLAEWADRRFKSYGERAHAVPLELGDALLRQARVRRRGVFDVLTLRGWLDRQYDDPSRKQRLSPTRLRELYKLYSGETACVLRVERLDGEPRRLLERAILEFGGLLPRTLYERAGLAEGPWRAQCWREQLEGSLVGTVVNLDLARFGIQQQGEALVVFNEVTLSWLKRVAVPSDPDHPHFGVSLGVDLASNLSRFVGFIVEHNVRFTMRGEIFKTTEKKIQQELIKSGGRELSPDEILSYLLSTCRDLGLIESTGERTFALAAPGRAWEQNDLQRKLEVLLERAVEEKGLAGDPFHQVRLRRIFLRLLRRLEPEVWYDLMYLPFLARNTYLASLDELASDDYYGARAHSARASASLAASVDDTQRLAWNLARWVRQRLHILGLVDLGYDAAGRPVALQLTKVGARVLGEKAGGLVDGSPLGSLIVTPDFEIVLFKTGDDAALTHELDRFCARSAMGETLRFQVTEKSVLRALSEGVHLSRILGTLQAHSRVPVPQNVVFSIRDWAARGGVMHLNSQLVLSSVRPDALARVLHDPAARNLVRAALDAQHLQLKARATPKRTMALLRDLGFLVELE